MTSPDALAVVVVTHNSAEHLLATLSSVLGQLEAEDQLVVVDNASVDDTAALARRAGDRVAVIETGANLGFAAGCHAGARATEAPLLLFLNPDCEVEPGCLAGLRRARSEQPSWGAWQAAVLRPGGRINTDGGVVHYIGAGWAGDNDKPLASLPRASRAVAFASGAALVVRREVWEQLDGLDPSYFLYSEDLDLGLRLWLAGYGVGMVPDARVLHRYEFDKGAQKWFWLERNRWRTVLSVYPTAVLVLLWPALVAAELGLMVIAARNGWLPAKLRAQAAVFVGLPATLRRRRSVQGTRRITAREFASHLSASLDNAYLPAANVGWAAKAQDLYWGAVQRILGVAGT